MTNTYKKHLETVQHLASGYLSDCYVQMIGENFPGMGEAHCALEFRHEHSHKMTPKQLRALNKFIDFWEALENLEHETRKAALDKQLQCAHVMFGGKK